MRNYLNDFSLFLTETKKSSKNTVESYVRDIKAYLSYAEINSVNINKVTKDDINTYLENLKNIGKTQATIVRNLASIKCFYDYLVVNNEVKLNPAKEIKSHKCKSKLPEILSSREIDLLLAQPDVSTMRGLRDKAMLELLYATGLRVSELIELNVDDINLNVGIVLCRSKNNERIIPIYKSALKYIENYLLMSRSSIVLNNSEKTLFVNMNGGKMTRQGFWKIIKSYAEVCGIEKSITPHTIRHSFAAHLLENGAGLKDIKEMLGHAGVSSTQIYSQIIKQKYENSYNKFHPKAGL